LFLLSIFLFALALSLDGFGMGLSYGLRKIKIVFSSLLIICLSSAMAIIVSMLFGEMLGSFLSERTASFLGACILIIVGIWISLQNYFLNLVGPHIYSLDVPQLGIVINILKEPVQADLNRSGEIDFKEAFLLGFALAMDALGAGFGAALAGYSFLWTPLMVAVIEFIMINAGVLLGKKLCFSDLQKGITLIPGGMIIILGLTKLIRL